MNRASSTPSPFAVLIAGGGVAALEAALALNDLAEGRVSTTLLAPEPSFVYRPARVLEPFALSAARTYPLDEIARDLDLALVRDGFKWLDASRSVVHTEHGKQVRYDALVLAMGAQLRPAFEHALTIDESRLDEQLHGLIQDVEGGYVHSIAFVAPSAMPWPLPIYELALMTARRAYEMQVDLFVTIATLEDCRRPGTSRSIPATGRSKSIGWWRCRSCSGHPHPGCPAVRAAASSRSIRTAGSAPSRTCSPRATPPSSRSSTAASPPSRRIARPRRSRRWPARLSTRSRLRP
jgi:hypothetical protein